MRSSISGLSMFPECADTQALKEAMFDRFEFFIARQRDGMLKTDFENDLVGRQRRIVATQPAAVDAPRACRMVRWRLRCAWHPLDL